LFLDAGGSLPSGLIDYTWQEDQIRAAKLDILIAAGFPEEAIEPYSQIIILPTGHL
jgi:hypothetical protein